MLPRLTLAVGVTCTTVVLALAQQPAQPLDLDRLKVGLQADGRVVVPTNQVLRPAGVQVTFPGRPVDLALAEGGKTLVVLNLRDLVVLDVATGQVKQTLELYAGDTPEPVYRIQELLGTPTEGKGPPPRAAEGFSVVGLLAEGDRVYASDSGGAVRVAQRRADGKFAWADPVALIPPRVGGLALPAGMAAHGADGLWVASSRGNTVQLVNRATGQVEQQVSVGVAPFAVVSPRPDRVYVSNWGGNPPQAGEPQALSSGTPVRIDFRTGVVNQGTVSILAPEPGRWRQIKSIPVGLHPSGMAVSPKGNFVYVANANSDTVSVLDTRSETVVETITVRPQARFPFGSGANALTVSPDGGTLYVCNGSNNCVAVVSLGTRATEAAALAAAEQSRLLGLIPVGWHPGAVRLSADGKKLFVANVKGVGSLAKLRPAVTGKNTHDFLGSVSVIDVPTAAQLAAHTREVNANNRLFFSLAGLEKPRPNGKPVPVPERHGEPSVFKHVIYVIKENRGYDQILGDMKEGDGDPKLCLFGEEVTPNYHALSR